MKPEELAKHIVSQISAAVNKSLKEMRDDFDKKLAETQTAFENRFASMPTPEKGEKGDPGETVVGPAGKDGEPGPQGERGEKGEAGADAVFDEKKTWDMIAEQFKTVELPTPEKGEKGDPGEIDMEAVRELIAKEISTMSIPGGKSITHEEIEDEIKDKSYARGTLAKHQGGLWRAHARTKGMAGWECLVAGIADISMEFDGERTVKITAQKSDGDPVVKIIKIDAPRFRDIWREGESYEKHDWVQSAGSIWMALKDTATRPGSSDDWKLIVKRGGTGKSAYDIAREAGFTGTRQEWLDSLGKKPIVKV